MKLQFNLDINIRKLFITTSLLGGFALLNASQGGDSRVYPSRPFSLAEPTPVTERFSQSPSPDDYLTPPATVVVRGSTPEPTITWSTNATPVSRKDYVDFTGRFQR